MNLCIWKKMYILTMCCKKRSILKEWNIVWDNWLRSSEEVIELFYLKEKSYKTISDMTGIDTNKVRSFIQNGRRNLKICMEKKAMENI